MSIMADSKLVTEDLVKPDGGLDYGCSSKRKMK
jgi:hypothetical protein